jgi:hypothetical protein
VFKFRVAIAAFIILMLLAGCGGGEQPQQAPGGNTTSNSSAEATALAAADATAQAAIDSGSAESAETAAAAAIETEVAINDKNKTQATAPARGGGIDLSKVDPCTILTREEVEAIVGPLDWNPRPASDAINGGKRCYLAPGMKVVLSVGQPEMYETESVTSIRVADLPALGDEAFASERCVNALLRGKAAVHVCIFDFSGPFNQDHARQLAQKMIERLP